MKLALETWLDQHSIKNMDGKSPIRVCIPQHNSVIFPDGRDMHVMIFSLKDGFSNHSVTLFL